jgi:hypothetical protein
MAKCLRCGNKSLFLKVNRLGLCEACEGERLRGAEESLREEFLSIMDKFKKAINPKMYDEVLKALKEIRLNALKLKLIDKVIASVSSDSAPYYYNSSFGILDKLTPINNKTLLEQCIEKVVREKNDYPNIPSYKLYESEIFKVVGVTFNNGRRNRQTILRQIYFRDPPYSKKPNITLQKYEFEERPAIAVYANKEQVGNIAEKDLEKILYRWDRYDKVTDFDVYGGGIDDEGNRRNYGMEIRVRFKKLL